MADGGGGSFNVSRTDGPLGPPCDTDRFRLLRPLGTRPVPGDSLTLVIDIELRHPVIVYNRGGFSFLTGGSFSTSWMWKMSPGKLPCPRTWNNIKKDFFLIYLGVN